MRSLSWVRDHRSPLAAGSSLLGVALLFAASDLPRGAALAFAAAGALALVSRVVVRVDARREHARLRWTILGIPFLPMGKVPLASVRAVRIERVVGKKRTDFHVQLEAERAFRLWSTTDLLRARRLAERVALGLALPLHDGSTGRFRMRDADELDLTLGERLRRAGPPPRMPVPPEGSSLRLRGGTRSEIEIPGQKLPPLFVVFWLAGPAFFGVAFWMLATPRTGFVALPIVGFIGAAFVWALASATRSKVVVVAPDGVEVRRLGSRKRIAFADLEELVHARDGLHLLSDEAHLRIPWAANEAEARFVAEVIEHAAYHHLAAVPSVAAVAPRDAPGAARHWAPPPAAAPEAEKEAPARRRRRQADRGLLQIGVLFLLVGLGGVGGAGYWASTVHEFVGRATVTSGTVIELRESRTSRRGGRVYRPVVRFQLPSGKPVVFTSRSGSNPAPYAVGDRIEVRYDPARPADAREGSLRSVWAWPVVAGGMAAIFVLAGVAGLGWYRQEAREARESALARGRTGGDARRDARSA